jgi:hypothetical protein
MLWVVSIHQTINLPWKDLIQEWGFGCQCHRCLQGNHKIFISNIKFIVTTYVCLIVSDKFLEFLKFAENIEIPKQTDVSNLTIVLT